MNTLTQYIPAILATTGALLLFGLAAIVNSMTKHKDDGAWTCPRCGKCKFCGRRGYHPSNFWN